MDIFQNQCSESLGFDSMLASNSINSPLQSTDSSSHLTFSSSPYFTTIPSISNGNSGCNTVPATNLLSSVVCSGTTGPNDVVLPSIFVKVPMQINQQYQQQSQSRASSSANEIKCEDKSQPIKRELGDLRALEKGTAMVQLPATAQSYLVEEQQTQQEAEELRVHCCELCPFATLVEQNLRDHVHAKHPGGVPEATQVFECPACENKFRQRSSLERHLLEDHMMIGTEVGMFMDSRFPCEEPLSNTNNNSISQEILVPVSGSQSVTVPEPNKSRIYIKNVQLLKKPDVIEQENVQEAQQAEEQQQQQQNRKIFIRNVSLLQNANFAQGVENVDFRNPSGLHESKYSFVVPAPSPNSQSPPISESQLNAPSQRNKIFIRNVDILRNPMLPITPPTIISTCDLSRASSSESLYTTPPPPVVSPATSMSCVGGPSIGSGLNMLILPTPICSSNSSTPPTTATPPAITVASGDFTLQQPRKSKIFIKNISVLKQPTIHLKSVDELNLMTIDQLQLQNLLPPTNSNSSTQGLVGNDMGAGDVVQQMEEEDFGNILNGTSSELDVFHEGTGGQYEELQVCGSVEQQEQYHQEFDNDFIIIEPGGSAENIHYEDHGEQLRLPPTATEMIDHHLQLQPTQASEPANINHQQQQQQQQQQLHQSHQQQFSQSDEDILFVCAEEIINLDPPIPSQEKLSSDLPEMDISQEQPPISEVSHMHPQQGRIYVSENLMEPVPIAPPPPPPPPSSPLSLPVDSSISPLSRIEQIAIDVPTGELPVVATSSGPSSSAEKERTRSRGRPKGAKQTGITKLKKLYTNLTPVEEGYKCDLVDCGARFRQHETLAYHKNCHVFPGDGQSSPEATIRCPECGSQEFRNWNTLHTHLWREHAVDMELYSCHLCNFKTPVLCRLNNTHMKIHSDEKNFICAICCKGFKNNKQLRNHRRSHRDQQQLQQRKEQRKERPAAAPEGKSTSQQSVKCVKCSLKFSSQKTLKAHVENKHVGDGAEGRMKCSLCGMVFKTRYLLQSHVAKHSDEKKFKCANCDYSTNDHNAIRRHRMRHNSGGHMYRCSYCDYTSIQSTTYRKHLERMHADIASNLLYKCSKCNFVSISEVKYQLHWAKHEPNANGGAEAELDAALAEEDPERLCESVNSDVVIVERDAADVPPMDAFSLIPAMDHHLQPMIRPAGFANNLSKVDNFYGYTTLENVVTGGQPMEAVSQQQQDLQLMAKVDDGGEVLGS